MKKFTLTYQKLQNAVSGSINCRNTAVSGSRKWTKKFLDPEIVEMVQFLDPEIAEKLADSGSICKYGPEHFWIQKLSKC